jgi:hypothetical protein
MQTCGHQYRNEASQHDERQIQVHPIHVGPSEPNLSLFVSECMYVARLRDVYRESARETEGSVQQSSIPGRAWEQNSKDHAGSI